MARFVFYGLPQEATEEIARLRWQMAGSRVLLACYRLEALLAKANFNSDEARVPAGSGKISGQWTRVGGGAGNSPGQEPVRVAQNEDEENPQRSFLQELLDPTAEVRTEAFNNTLRSIRRLEPNNQQLTFVAAPNFAPSWQTVNDVNAELEAARKRVADSIANGHAFEKHAGEFPVFTRGQFSTIVRDTISNPAAEIIDLPSGRTAFYTQSNNTLVIVDTNNSDSGTMFKPSAGQRYVERIKKRK